MESAFAEDLAVVTQIDAVPKILEVVCRTTGMGFAAVARVTEDRWIACAVLDQIEFGLQPGGESGAAPRRRGASFLGVDLKVFGQPKLGVR